MLKLSKSEREKLAVRIDTDFTGSVSDHQRRMQRFVRYYERIRNIPDPDAPVDGSSTFSVPMMQWQVFGKWADTMQQILGDDAEIVAEPIGPIDQRLQHKVGRYMTWRLFRAMKIARELAIWAFRAIVFGRAHAYRPWVLEKRTLPNGEQQVLYDGPKLEALWPDDIIVPAEDVRSIQEFSFVIRKFRARPQDLLDGERDGVYEGIAENFERIVQQAQVKRRDATADSDQLHRSKDAAESVTFESSLTYGDALPVYEWFGRWRLPKRLSRSPDLLDMKARELDETDLRVYYLPDLNLVIGVEKLEVLYPMMKNRRPFAECALIHDGSYWSPGFGELLESIEDEATSNHRLFTNAGEISVGPLIVYRPASGFDPETFEYKPWQAVPSEDPAGVNVISPRADLNYPIAKEQVIKGYAEMVTGISDMTLGKSIDRPNAPRTATGQLALLERGNVRAFLDVMFLREDLRMLVNDIWDLELQFSPPEVFFRVTEEEAKGLFDVVRGGAVLKQEERANVFDFDIKFATSVWSREAAKERQLQLYQLDLANPLIQQDPRALWMITQQVHKAMGDDNFSDIVPEPPDLDAPKNPKQEWVMARQGEDIKVNMADNDDAHLEDHLLRVQEAEKSGEDPKAVNRMIVHIAEHQKQKRKKLMLAALTEQLATTVPDEGLGIEQAAGAAPEGSENAVGSQ